MKKFACLFITIIIFAACSKKIEKVIAESFPDGNPKLVKYLKKEEGKTVVIKEIVYYPDGKMRYEGEYKNGQRHGKWVYYYPNGKKWSEGIYLNGKRNGLGITWHKNGQIYYQGEYKDGIRTGTWKFWDEEGVFVKEVEYDSE